MCVSIFLPFNRFVWLIQLPTRSSGDMARKLNNDMKGIDHRIVFKVTPGLEFHGRVESICKNYKIRRIWIRSSHPQSQGKVERWHRRLLDKMMFDLLASYGGERYQLDQKPAKVLQSPKRWKERWTSLVKPLWSLLWAKIECCDQSIFRKLRQWQLSFRIFKNPKRKDLSKQPYGRYRHKETGQVLQLKVGKTDDWQAYASQPSTNRVQNRRLSLTKTPYPGSRKHT